MALVRKHRVHVRGGVQWDTVLRAQEVGVACTLLPRRTNNVCAQPSSLGRPFPPNSAQAALKHDACDTQRPDSQPVPRVPGTTIYLCNSTSNCPSCSDVAPCALSVERYSERGEEAVPSRSRSKAPAGHTNTEPLQPVRCDLHAQALFTHKCLTGYPSLLVYTI